MKVLKERPWLLPRFAGWLLKGKSYFKEKLYTATTLDPSLLPYNQKLVRWLQAEYKRGRTICLITAS
ncbi:MAG: UbiA family prenyltransferase, partial [Acidobacteriota bacterium]